MEATSSRLQCHSAQVLFLACKMTVFHCVQGRVERGKGKEEVRKKRGKDEKGGRGRERWEGGREETLAWWGSLHIKILPQFLSARVTGVYLSQ